MTALGDWYAPGLPWWAWSVLLASLVAAAVRLGAADARTLGRVRGSVLIALRLALFAGLATLLLDPSSRTVDRRLETPRIVIVVDDSASTTLGAVGETAAAAIDRAIAGDAIEDIARRWEIEWRSLSAPERPLERGGIARLERTAPTTDLSGVARAIASVDDPVAAIVLTDGGQTERTDPTTRAADAGDSGIPWFLVGTGPRATPDHAGIVRVDVPDVVRSGEAFDVAIVVTARSSAPREIALEIDWGTETRAATVAVGAGEAEETRTETLTATGEGRHRLRVAIAGVSRGGQGDPYPSDDAREIPVDVTPTGARSLVIDGGPRWEFRRLVSSWRRDAGMTLDARLLGPRSDEVPPARESAYDIIVIGDVPPSALGPSLVDEWLARVEADGGVIAILAGPRAMPEVWRDHALGAALPVELLLPAPPREAGALLARGGVTLELTAAGERASAMRLLPGRGVNRELWPLLPGPHWIAPIEAAAPEATTWVEARLPTDGRIPIVATRPHGAGDIVWVGSDETWRWRTHWGDRFPERFWNGLLDEARRSKRSASEGSDDALVLRADPAIWTGDRTIVIDARRRTLPGAPRSLLASIEKRADGQWIEVDRVRLVPRDEAGRYLAGEWSPDDVARGVAATETLEVRVRALLGDAAYDRREERASASITLAPPPPPELVPRPRNEGLLEDLARASGGRHRPVEEIASLPGDLPHPEIAKETVHVWSPRTGPYPLALALLALLVAEWILRKVWRLV